jgi:hypothetical protein
MEEEIKSELFSNSYAIFIDSEDIYLFKKAISRTNLDKVGVKVLKSNFDTTLSTIVIPSSMDFMSIEKYLFGINGRKGQFWGQFGLGYSGKTWNVV